MDATTTGLAVGAVVGLILALTGAGGGILAVPLLIFGARLPIAEAAPVGLIGVGLASAFGAVVGLRQRIVRYRAAAVIGGAGMTFAPLGVTLAHAIPNGPLTVAFAVVLALVGIRMFRQSRGVGPGERHPATCLIDPATGRFAWTVRCARVMATTGVVSGLLSGMLGVGGGFVIVPSLTRFSNLDARGIVATSLAVIALVSVAGVWAAEARGAVQWSIAGPFALGAVLALLAGQRIAARVAGARLQQAFAVTCWCVAAMLVARTIEAALKF